MLTLDDLLANTRTVPGPLDTPCQEWAGSVTQRGGYGKVYSHYVSETGRSVYLAAHRMVVELTDGVPLGSDLVVRHRCDNPPCIRRDHLLVGTHKDNTADMMSRRRGSHFAPGHRTNRGAANPASKLTPEKVRSIRKALAGGEGRGAIAARFGVSRGTIRGIAVGEVWAHVV